MVRVSIDQAELARFKRDLDRFEPALARALKRNIREVGKEAAEAVREKVQEPSPSGNGGESVGSRQAIARATRVSVTFGSRTAGVRVRTGDVRGGFSKAYNMKSFRHPVFGRRDTWAGQQGRPYFGAAINKTMREELVQKVGAALDESVRAIGGKAF